ncbi:MAG: fibronectin type III domain-containing protein [Bacteroidota bacterium]
MRPVIMFLFVKLGFTKLNPQDKVSKALSIAEALTANPNFPVTDPTSLVVETAANEVQAAIAEAQNKDRQKIAIKNQKVAALDALMSTLQSDINTKSGGDPAKIYSAGMEPVDPRSPVGILGPVEDLTIKLGEFPGSVDIKWKPIKKRLLYAVEYTLSPMGPGDNWLKAGDTTKAKITLSDMQSGQTVYFRITCVSTAGKGPYSEVISIRVY